MPLDRRLYNGLSLCAVMFVFTFVLTTGFSTWFSQDDDNFISNFKTKATVINNEFSSSKSTFIDSRYNNESKSYNLDELPLDDINTLINITNFEFLINHDRCNRSDSYLVLLIHSAPGNFVKRKVIRETWYQNSTSVFTFFLVGLNDQYQLAIENENKKFNDIIQGNFVDSYRNMTYKHLMALKWMTYHCSNARYLLKLDDDVFVNAKMSLEFLRKRLNHIDTRKFIMCYMLPSLMVKRSWRSKWRVSFKEYSGRRYPPYCAGWAILYSIDTVYTLYREGQKEPFFWIDDVHITGTLAKKANITHTSINSNVLTREEMNNLLQQKEKVTNFLFGPPNLTVDEIKSLNNIVNF